MNCPPLIDLCSQPKTPPASLVLYGPRQTLAFTMFDMLPSFGVALRVLGQVRGFDDALAVSVLLVTRVVLLVRCIRRPTTCQRSGPAACSTLEAGLGQQSGAPVPAAVSRAWAVRELTLSVVFRSARQVWPETIRDVV